MRSENRIRFERRNYLEFFVNKKKIGCCEQIREACVLTPTINEENIVQEVSGAEILTHFLTVPWKLLFAFLIPPKNWVNGWATVIMAFSVIGLVTIIIADFAYVLECTLNVKVTVTALTILSIGFSLPDIFTTAIAAKLERNADAAIANVMGLNAMNFFLGICLPWLYATIYLREKKDTDYPCDQEVVVWSLLMYLGTAIIGLIAIGMRRCICKGEIGGANGCRVFAAAFLILLWVAFVVLVCLYQYKVFYIDTLALV